MVHLSHPMKKPAVVIAGLVLVYLGIHGLGSLLHTHPALSTRTAMALPKPPIIFLANDLRDFVVADVQMASLYNPGTPIYLITSCDQFTPDRSLQLEQLLALPLVRLKLIEHFLGEGTGAAAFAEIYWLHSVTTFKFDLFNFQRFFAIRDVAQQEGFMRFWLVDFDIALFSDIGMIAQETPAADLVVLNSFSTFFSLWSLRTLHRFCDYMMDFYAQPTEQIEADIWRYGQRLNETWAQWSDMFILHAFIETHKNELQLKFLVQGSDDKPVFQYPVVGNYLKGHLRYLGIENLGLLLGWDCKESEFDRLVKLELSGGKYVPVYNQTTLLGLHFQGYYCKQWASKRLEQMTESIQTRKLEPLGSM